jgi:hypothetical protein
LLYHSLGGRVTLNRVYAEGNAGNQVKVTGETEVINSVLVGNCGFFEGQPFTHHVDNCRAMGNTLEITYTGGERATIVNSTLYGQGDGLVCAGPREGYRCSGSESLTAWNNVFQGDLEFLGDGEDITFLFYQEGCGSLKLASDYNIAHDVKNLECQVDGEYVSSGVHDLCQDPLLAGPLAGSQYGLRLTAGSPAIDAGSIEGAPAVDFDGRTRDEAPDMGAYEYGAEPVATATPTVVATSTPTATATAAATATPTAVATSTPTATATPTAAVTSTPTAVSTASSMYLPMMLKYQ